MKPGVDIRERYYQLGPRRRVEDLGKRVEVRVSGNQGQQRGQCAAEVQSANRGAR